MDHFEVAARGAYVCFRSAGGKLIIVKRLWACYMEKAQNKCTTLLFYFTICGAIQRKVLKYMYFSEKQF